MIPPSTATSTASAPSTATSTASAPSTKPQPLLLISATKRSCGISCSARRWPWIWTAGARRRLGSWRRLGTRRWRRLLLLRPPWHPPRHGRMVGRGRQAPPLFLLLPRMTTRPASLRSLAEACHRRRHSLRRSSSGPPDGFRGTFPNTQPDLPRNLPNNPRSGGSYCYNNPSSNYNYNNGNNSKSCKLRNRDGPRDSGQGSGAMFPPSSASEARATAGSGTSGGMTCFACHRPGHFQAGCKNPPFCLICYEDGHLTVECPNRIKPLRTRCMVMRRLGAASLGWRAL